MRTIVLAIVLASIAAPVHAATIKPNKFDLVCGNPIIRYPIDMGNAKVYYDSKWTELIVSAKYIESNIDTQTGVYTGRTKLIFNRVTADFSYTLTISGGQYAPSPVYKTGSCTIERYTGPGAETLF